MHLRLREKNHMRCCTSHIVVLWNQAGVIPSTHLWQRQCFQHCGTSSPSYIPNHTTSLLPLCCVHSTAARPKLLLSRTLASTWSDQDQRLHSFSTTNCLILSSRMWYSFDLALPSDFQCACCCFRNSLHRIWANTGLRNGLCRFEVGLPGGEMSMPRLLLVWPSFINSDGSLGAVVPITS